MLFTISTLLNFTQIVLAKKFECGPAKKECDWYICADSKYVDRKHGKCMESDFCSSSTSISCRRPRKKCKKESECSSSSSSSSTSSSSSSSSSSERFVRRDALFVIEEILACEALEARALVTVQGDAIEAVVTKTLGDLAIALPPAIQSITNSLVLTITGILTAEEAVLEEEVEIIVGQANGAFTAAALQGIHEYKLLAESQISDLGRRSSDFIVRYVRNSHHGLAKLIGNDFDNASKQTAASFANVIALENEALILALAGVEADVAEQILAAVAVANAQIIQTISDSIAQATTKILSQVSNSLSELSLGLDLLFCETGHLITDIVKQVYDGKKVAIPRRISGRNLGPVVNGVPARCGALRGGVL